MSTRYIFYQQSIHIEGPTFLDAPLIAVVSNFTYRTDIADFLDDCQANGVSTIYTPGFATATFPDEKTFLWFKLKWGYK